jgi:hypothetical protein
MVACVPGIAVGAFVAAAHGVDVAAFVPNVAGAVLGMVAIACAARPSLARAALRVMPVVAALAVVASLWGPHVPLQGRSGPGIDDVHRWIALGGLRIHPSMALGPWLIVAVVARGPVPRALLPLGVAMLAHVVQPDAGQATVLAVGGGAALLGGTHVTRASVVATLLLVALCAAAWARPDRLAPVAHVEHILRLAFARPSMTAAALVALAALAAPFALKPRNPLSRSFLAMGVASVGVTAIGAFPVPVVGAGFSGVFGVASALAALAAVDAGAIVGSCAPSSPPRPSP